MRAGSLVAFLISDEEFLKERKDLQSQIAKISQGMRETEKRAEHWIELTEKTFIFACYAMNEFRKGILETQREILSALGQNYTLKDGNLVIVPNEWFVPIQNGYPAIESEYHRLELENNEETQRQKAAFATFRPILRERRDLNPQPPP